MPSTNYQPQKFKSFSQSIATKLQGAQRFTHRCNLIQGLGKGEVEPALLSPIRSPRKWRAGRRGVGGPGAEHVDAAAARGQQARIPARQGDHARCAVQAISAGCPSTEMVILDERYTYAGGGWGSRLKKVDWKPEMGGSTCSGSCIYPPPGSMSCPERSPAAQQGSSTHDTKR